MSQPSLDIIKTLKTCVIAALCSQRYILNDVLCIQDAVKEDPLGKFGASNVHSPPLDSGEDEDVMSGTMQLTQKQQERLRQSISASVDISAKGELAHRASSTTDLVTSADVMVQHVVEAFLRSDFGLEDGTDTVGGKLPFTVVGEEEPTSDADADGSSIDNDRNAKAVGGALEYRERMTQEELQLLLDLDTHVARYEWALEDYCVSATSWESMRKRVAIFIDPIDGTNAFVEGELHVPMTLIGIAVDGVPVAGVVNRVFLTDSNGSMNISSMSVACSSLRQCVNVPRAFVVISGSTVDPSSLPAPSTVAALGSKNDSVTQDVLVVTYSSSTKESIMQPPLDMLKPIVDAPARGAGYKIMMIVDRIAGPLQAETADVFLSPNAAIKKWDSCAPHAILSALGGRATDMQGTPIAYHVVVKDQQSLMGGGEGPCSPMFSRSETIPLNNGFVGMRNATVFEAVKERFQW